MNNAFCVQALEKFIETDVESEAANLICRQLVLFAQQCSCSFYYDSELFIGK